MTHTLYRNVKTTDESVFFVDVDGEGDLTLWHAEDDMDCSMAVCQPLLRQKDVHPVIWEASITLVNHTV
jgi:hypothetical protein